MNIQSYNVVIIGSSAGGPRILKDIFTEMPLLNGSIIIVQHMPRFVNSSFSGSLNAVTDLEVDVASHGERLMPGRVYVAPSERHLVLAGNSEIHLTRGEKVNFVCPSIDVAMESLQPDGDLRFTGIVLTGMGADGARGIVHVKRIGGSTIAQDELSSIVYGMPKKAVETGAVDSVLSPPEIRNHLISKLGILKKKIIPT